MKLRQLFVATFLGCGLVMAVVLVFAVPSALADGGNYYVATTGNDTTGDGSAAKPWKTISHAVATVPASSDPANPNVIHVAAGTYNDANGDTFPIDFNNANVSLTGAGTATTIIDAEGSTDDILRVLAAGISIQGFTVQNSGDDAIVVLKGGGTIIANNVFSTTGDGVDLEIWGTLDGSAYTIEPITITTNSFDGANGVQFDFSLAGDNTATDLTIGAVSILSNTFNTKRYGIYENDFDVITMTGGSVAVGDIIIANNTLTGGDRGIYWNGDVGYWIDGVYYSEVYAGFNDLTGTVVTFGDFVVRDNTFNNQLYDAIFIDDAFNIEPITNTTVTAGDLIFTGNTITDQGDYGIGVWEFYNPDYWYGSSSGTFGDLIIRNNTISTTSNYEGISFGTVWPDELNDTTTFAVGDTFVENNQVIIGNDVAIDGYLGADSLYNTVAITMGTTTIQSNTITSAGRGIYLDHEFSYYMYDNTTATGGEVLISANTISSTTEGIYLYLYGPGYYNDDNSVATIDAITLSNNVITTTDDGIYVEYYEFTDMDGNARVTIDDLTLTGNSITASSDGIYIYYYDEYVVEYMYGGYLKLPDTIVTDNIIRSGDDGIDVYNAYNPYGMYNDAVLDYGSFTVNNNTLINTDPVTTSSDYGFYYYTYEFCYSECSGTSGTSIGDITITANSIEGYSADSIEIYHDSLGYELVETGTITLGNVLVGGNTITNTGYGIDVYYDLESYDESALIAGTVNITANTVTDAADGGINLMYYTDAYDNSTHTLGAVSIENNTVTNCGNNNDALIRAGIGIGAGIGVDDENMAQASVSGNTVTNCVIGAGVESVVDVTVANNLLTGNRVGGLAVGGYLNNTIAVSHNTVTSSTLSSGIGMATLSGNIILTDIDVSNYATSILNMGSVITTATDLSVDGDIHQGSALRSVSLMTATSPRLATVPTHKAEPADMSTKQQASSHTPKRLPSPAKATPHPTEKVIRQTDDVVTFAAPPPSNAAFYAKDYAFDIGGNLILEMGRFYVPTEIFTLTGQFTHTGGTYYQTLPVNGSADVGFPKAGGLILNANGLDLGSTDVAITAGADCADVPTGAAAQHCYVITPTNTTGRQATVTFYYRNAELPLGQTCSLMDAYLWDGTWDNLYEGDNRQCTAEPLSVRAAGIDEFGSFTLRSLFVTATKDDSVANDLNNNGLPDVGDTVQYEIVVANVGDSDAVNVQFTDTPDTNSILQTGTVNTTQGNITSGNGGSDTSVAVDIGTIGLSGRVTITFDVVVNRPDGVETISNQGTVSGTNFFSLLTDDPDTATYGDATRSTAAYRYLPLILKNFTSAPDLVITNLVVSGDNITVTIKNQGNAAATDPFWLDVYFNPSQTPGLNQPWQRIAPAGAAWGITGTIASGDSLTLTVGDAYYDPANSATSFPAGATVYGFVDSVNHTTSYGNVWELDETNNLWPMTKSAITAAASLLGQSDDSLPRR